MLAKHILCMLYMYNVWLVVIVITVSMESLGGWCFSQGPLLASMLIELVSCFQYWVANFLETQLEMRILSGTFPIIRGNEYSKVENECWESNALKLALDMARECLTEGVKSVQWLPAPMTALAYSRDD